MMESLDDVFTDIRLNRGLVEQALAATATEPVPILGRYTALASGGVSGQRGLFVNDPHGHCHPVADTIVVHRRAR